VQPLDRKPGQGSLGDLALLEGGHRQLWDAVSKAFPGFDLDEHQSLVDGSTGDDVHLAPPAAEVALKDAVAAGGQEGAGNFLTLVAGAFVYVFGFRGHCIVPWTYQSSSPGRGGRSLTLDMVLSNASRLPWAANASR